MIYLTLNSGLRISNNHSILLKNLTIFLTFSFISSYLKSLLLISYVIFFFSFPLFVLPQLITLAHASLRKLKESEWTNFFFSRENTIPCLPSCYQGWDILVTANQIMDNMLKSLSSFLFQDIFPNFPYTISFSISSTCIVFCWNLIYLSSLNPWLLS